MLAVLGHASSDPIQTGSDIPASAATPHSLPANEEEAQLPLNENDDSVTLSPTSEENDFPATSLEEEAASNLNTSFSATADQDAEWSSNLNSDANTTASVNASTSANPNPDAAVEDGTDDTQNDTAVASGDSAMGCNTTCRIPPDVKERLSEVIRARGLNQALAFAFRNQVATVFSSQHDCLAVMQQSENGSDQNKPF